MSLDRETRRALHDVLSDCHSASQFVHCVQAALDDLTRSACRRHVGDVGPDEVFDMVSVLATLKGRYIAEALAEISSKRNPAALDVGRLRVLREQIREIESALDAVRSAIDQELVGVRGVNAPSPTGSQPVLRNHPE
ncbi:hypothetical protein IHV25_03220 [Phaeovibrio sulfidiphilus]|uniref:Uncharacterized protein n=1 Tax=Phaeovibrio sulfidiphilus TaxID=1220600 RepID=A0A8J7CBY2_9PROT|nr:hypothetical protein [Phaeovibrio sulfidiphilus]MBE1236663.1 hypothetical protein [Phaeovibrio sulfidiphilus]